RRVPGGGQVDFPRRRAERHRQSAGGGIHPDRDTDELRVGAVRGPRCEAVDGVRLTLFYAAHCVRPANTLAAAPLLGDRMRHSIVNWFQACFAGCVMLACLAHRAPSAAAQDRGFSLGIAAGDATANSAILWTRVDTPGDVALRVAQDADLNDLVWQ